MYNLELNTERICHLAKARGISVNKMLKEADLSASIIDNMKRNQKPSIDKIQTIAEYFNVSIDYLVGRTDVPEVMGLTENNRQLTQDEKDILHILNSIDSEHNRAKFIGYVECYAQQIIDSEAKSDLKQHA